MAGAAAPILGLTGPGDLIAWTALAVGALAPDLDGGGLVTKPSAWIPDVIPVPAFVDRAGRAFGRLVFKIFGHRGMLHYPVVAVVLGVLAVALHIPWLAWLAVGYASHLLADSVTKMGIPILGPLSSERYGLGPRSLRVSTGGQIETLILTVAWVGFLGLGLMSVVGIPVLVKNHRKTHLIFLPYLSKGK